MRTLFTLVLLAVIGVSLMGISNAQIPYVRETVLYQITDNTSATSTGRTIFRTVPTLNTISGISSRRNLIYSINVEIMTTANNVQIYDALSYSDATLNNRILSEIQWANNTTVVRGLGVALPDYANQASTGVVALGGRGFAVLGAPTYTFEYKQPNGYPIFLERGLHIDGTDGAAPYTVRIVYFRE